MELNILDSAYLKLVRDSGADDQIKIPFTLESNSENEAEYLFYLSDCTFAQKLKGTLTYMLMVINIFCNLEYELLTWNNCLDQRNGIIPWKDRFQIWFVLFEISD